jgi:hypothetical protein
MSNVRLGDKVLRDGTTTDAGKVRLGDHAPSFRAGDKVTIDAATANQGQVRLGDMTPVFAPRN